MIKKQIQKLTLPKVLFLIVLFSMVFSQLFFTSPSPKIAVAADYGCTWTIQPNMPPPRIASPRPNIITFSEKTPILDSGKNSIGLEGKITVTYNPPTRSSEYLPLESDECQNKITGKVVLFDSVLSIGKIVDVTDIKVTTTSGGGGTLTGKFKIDNFSENINTIRYNISKETKFANYYLVFWTEDNGYTPGLATLKAITSSNNSSIVPLAGCTNLPGKICTNITSDGSTPPVSSDKLAIELSKVSFDTDIGAGDNLDIVPPERRSVDKYPQFPQQNFFRVYLGQKFNFDTFVYPKSPVGSFLSVKDNNGQTSKIVLPDKKFSEKELKSLGAGVFNDKLKWDSTNTSSIGCVNDTFSTADTVGSNSTLKYNWCRLDPAAKTTGFGIPMDGSRYVTFRMQMLEDSINKLFVSPSIIKCESDKKTCESESQEKGNIISITPVMDLDPDVWGDLTLTGVLTKSVALTALQSASKQWYGLPIAFGPYHKVYIVVYPNKESWEANKDKATPEWVPAPTTTTSTAQIKPVSASQTLYGFITRVISDIIVWLQSIIYRVFAFIVVPILNALLRVRPYEDAFVNVIYPGWLILRNLANIFFIVSLLVVGLRILFQLSASGTAVGFIRRLLIMALLVNFSLVISQGIIGIADTVQSQFLPANTKIIESLGQKLMVEPLKNFRAEVNNKEDSAFTEGDSELALADTVKPIVLLILSIAAFFSFVAVAAFLMVRLVVLWVLYMISPVAYVGFVMEETKKYASQWWSEFIKQAMLAPILVFFLNIAALMATVFSSGGANDLFSKFNPDGTLSGDVVIGSLTILTHFIVIGFLFAGMKFALGFGGIGSKAIVDYAKKGFDAVTTRPAKWAAGAAKDGAVGAMKDQYERKIKGGLFDPMAYKQAWKDSNEAKNKRLMKQRLANADGRLTPTSIINNPFKSARYVASGGRFGGEALLSGQARLEEEASIMDDAERATRGTDLVNAHISEENARTDLEYMDHGKMSFEMAQKILDSLDEKSKAYQKEGDKLRDDAREARGKGRGAEAAAKLAEAAEQDRLKILSDRAKTDLQAQVTRATGLGSDGVTIGTGLKAKIGVEINLDDVKKELEDKLEKLEEDSKNLEGQVNHDDDLRSKFGYGPGGKTMDATRRAQLEAEIEEYTKRINARKLPDSLAQKEARLTRERENDKLIEELDDDELQVHFQQALSDNNLDLATAIAKKIAKEGNFDQLLESSKDKDGKAYANNIDGFKKFMNEKFGKIAPSVRMQIGTEISSIAQKNGNYAISKSTQIAPDKSVSWRSKDGENGHNTKIDQILRGKKPEDMVKAKKFEITRASSPGRHVLYKGAVDNINDMNKAKLDKLKEQMSSKLAKHIVKSDNFLDIKEPQRMAILSAAGK